MATGFCTVIFFCLISSCYTWPDHHGKRRRMSENTKDYNAQRDHVVFPERTNYDDYMIKMSSRINPKVSKKKSSCIMNLCDEVDNYPTEYITRVMKDHKYDNLFNDDDIVPFDISQRNQFDGEETLCSTMQHVYKPKKAMNTNKTERIIVNIEGRKQTLVFETCVENTKCQFSEMFPNDYQTECKQRYVVRRLWALNDEKQPAFDSFEVPSCCVCTYKKK